MLAAVQRILAERSDFWPLSDHSIHYALLNDPPLRHAGKPGSVYANDRPSYHDLTDLLSPAWPNGMAVSSKARNASSVCTAVSGILPSVFSDDLIRFCNAPYRRASGLDVLRECGKCFRNHAGIRSLRLPARRLSNLIRSVA